jgi:acetaldehyde dehydrogenase (acetylating)
MGMDNGIDYDLQSVQQVRDLARFGEKATKEIATYSEAQIDKIIRNMVRVAEAHAQELAQMANSETGFGKVEDKIFKNTLASTVLYEYIKDMKTIGILSEDKAKGIIEVAEPVGLLMGIVPSTNPTSTAIFKSIIAIKSRNGIIFSPHPSAAKCTLRAAQLMNEAAVEAGAPQNIIGCISLTTIEATNELMKRPEVKMIIATGGPGMVKAAYSAGKPALGVGAGNTPAYIERSADVDLAVRNIIASKTFDNGTICASEQSVICEDVNREAVVAAFQRNGGYFMTAEETKKVSALLFKNGHAMNAKFVGRSAEVIAEGAGIQIPHGTKVLIGEQGGVGNDYPLSYEKLTTVLAFYTVRDWHEACTLCIDLLQNGIGHTLSLHTQSRDIVMEFSVKPASRILVNTGTSQGATGGSTGLQPSFTLGCGTWGGSSVSENVGPQHLINIKKIAYGIRDLVPQNPPTNTYNTAAQPTSSYSPAINHCTSPDEISRAAASQGGYTAASSCTAAPQVSSCGLPPAGSDPAAGLERLTAETLNYSFGGSGQGCSNCIELGADKPITKEDLADMIAAMTKAINGN